MANFNAKSFRKIGAGFPNKSELIRLKYSFADDGGEADDVLRLAQFSKNCILVGAWVHVKTAAVGASGTVTIGVTNDTDCITDATSGAVTALTLNAVIAARAAPVYCAADDYVLLDIATTDLSAGEFEIVLEVIDATN
jgi:hypothetical protein